MHFEAGRTTQSLEGLLQKVVLTVNDRTHAKSSAAKHVIAPCIYLAVRHSKRDEDDEDFPLFLLTYVYFWSLSFFRNEARETFGFSTAAEERFPKPHLLGITVVCLYKSKVDVILVPFRASNSIY